MLADQDPCLSEKRRSPPKPCAPCALNNSNNSNNYHKFLLVQQQNGPISMTCSKYFSFRGKSNKGKRINGHKRTRTQKRLICNVEAGLRCTYPSSFISPRSRFSSRVYKMQNAESKNAKMQNAPNPISTFHPGKHVSSTRRTFALAGH